jgi:pyruvate/2-oxoglutarate dehydrogenase complex dihydrolipoamide dehydrogenase (E3) component
MAARKMARQTKAELIERSFIKTCPFCAVEVAWVGHYETLRA